MSRSRRHERRGSIERVTTPLMPFLSIMLGLMSAMALITVILSALERRERIKTQEIKLVGIPLNFVPVYIRCQESQLIWYDPDGKSHVVQVETVAALLRNPRSLRFLPQETRAFIQMLSDRSNDNKFMSFHNRQYSIIVWVEPSGIITSHFLRIVVDRMQLPLRIGELPILENETIAQGFEYAQ